MSKLVLFGDHHWISPYVYSCFVGLEEKKLPFEVREVNLAEKAQLDPAFRDRSITGRVPALEHDGFWLAESSAIVEYLEEAFPDAPRLLPPDVRDRARARQVLGWIRSDLLALRDERSTTTMFYERATAALTPLGEAARAKLVQVAETLVPRDRPTIFASGFTLADADLAFMLHRLIANGDPLPDRVRAYAETHWARPSIRAFVTHARPRYTPY